MPNKCELKDEVKMEQGMHIAIKWKSTPYSYHLDKVISFPDFSSSPKLLYFHVTYYYSEKYKSL